MFEGLMGVRVHTAFFRKWLSRKRSRVNISNQRPSREFRKMFFSDFCVKVEIGVRSPISQWHGKFFPMNPISRALGAVVFIFISEQNIVMINKIAVHCWRRLPRTTRQGCRVGFH